MLINGQSVDNQSLVQVLDRLHNIPSAFAIYNREISPEIPDEQMRHYDKALSLKSQKRYVDALKSYDLAENALVEGEMRKPVCNHRFYVERAFIHENLGNLELAIQDLYTAQTVAKNNNQLPEIEKITANLAELHKKTNTLEMYKNNMLELSNSPDPANKFIARAALGAIEKLQGNHELAVQHYSNAFSLRQGVVDPDAHRVEQREVGYSQTEKIGTDNIQQCVVVIIRDPISHKTALAHVDRSTDIKSLSTVIQGFGDRPLEVMLVGGRDQSREGAETSNRNINNVTMQLQQHNNVNIISADIGTKDQASAIVFDPVSGKLTHNVPGKEHRTTSARQTQLSVNLRDGNIPLHDAFNLSETHSRFTEINFTKQQKIEIVHTALDDLYDAQNKGSPSWHGSTVRGRVELAQQIRQKSPEIFKQALQEYVGIKCANLVNKSTKQRIERQIQTLASEGASISSIGMGAHAAVNKAIAAKSKAISLRTLIFGKKSTTPEKQDPSTKKQNPRGRVR